MLLHHLKLSQLSIRVWQYKYNTGQWRPVLSMVLQLLWVDQGADLQVVLGAQRGAQRAADQGRLAEAQEVRQDVGRAPHLNAPMAVPAPGATRLSALLEAGAMT